MPNTLGYHIVISGYGLWLPGDRRGHWSGQFDHQIGYTHHHTLQPGDPIRRRMAEEQRKHPPVRLNASMLQTVAQAIGRCSDQSDWRVAAASVEPSHTHLLLTYTPRDINHTVKWLKDQATKAVHRQTTHQGPVWAEGRWRSFIFDEHVWNNTRRYIERHNQRRGQPAAPYPWITQSPDRWSGHGDQ